MFQMFDNLGPFLLTKENGLVVKKPTIEVLASKKKVALYFSASWCGPCKKFTPLLAEAYLKQESGVPIVFVTSDMDAEDFLG
jgi:nucleoredoxin